MKKTLTALALVGAWAFGGCRADTYTMTGEHMITTSKDGYTITVTDEERERIRGVLPRHVEVQTEAWGDTPYRVIGTIPNVLATKSMFVDGRLWHAATDNIGCYWGAARPGEDVPRCSATEVRNAQGLLTALTEYATR